MGPDEMSYLEQAFLSQGSTGLGFPSFLTGDNSREGETLLQVLLLCYQIINYCCLNRLERLRKCYTVPNLCSSTCIGH